MKLILNVEPEPKDLCIIIAKVVSPNFNLVELLDSGIHLPVMELRRIFYRCSDFNASCSSARKIQDVALISP